MYKELKPIVKNRMYYLVAPTNQVLNTGKTQTDPEAANRQGQTQKGGKKIRKDRAQTAKDPERWQRDDEKTRNDIKKIERP